MRVKSAKARIVLNSRGEPTIEVEINGVHEQAPSGLSTGKHEKPNVDPYEAARLFNSELAPVLKTMDFQTLSDFEELELSFFGMGGFEKFGANTLIATEYTILRAISKYEEIPVYAVLNKKPKFNIRLLSNVIGGGAHARWRGPSIQEFLVLPETDSFKTCAFINAYIHKLLQKRLEVLDEGFLGSKNDEGAWVTTLKIETILRVLEEVINKVETDYNMKVKLGIDVAASSLYSDNKYYYRREKLELTREEQITFIKDLISEFNIYYVEDPLHEEDFDGFKELCDLTNALIVGDDLTVTDPERIESAIKKNSIRGVIIKPNQVGSLLKTKKAIDIAKKHEIVPILSHRSGETESNILAHLAVGFEVPIVKFGIVGGERIVKINELIRIEETIKNENKEDDFIEIGL